MFAGIAALFAAKLGKLGGKLAEVIVALALLLALVGGPYWLGMRHQAQTDAAVQAKAQAVAAHKLAIAQAKGDAIAAQLAVAQANVKTVYKTITKEVPHVVYKYRPAPHAALQPIPHAVFTVGAVRLWDRALDPELPAAAGGAAEDAAATDPALDSGVSQQQLFANHVANAQRNTACRQQLSALIAWHHATDGRAP